MVILAHVVKPENVDQQDQKGTLVASKVERVQVDCKVLLA